MHRLLDGQSADESRCLRLILVAYVAAFVFHAIPQPDAKAVPESAVHSDDLDGTSSCDNSCKLQGFAGCYLPVGRPKSYIGQFMFAVHLPRKPTASFLLALEVRAKCRDLECWPRIAWP